MDGATAKTDAVALIGALLAGLVAWTVAPRPVAPALALTTAHALLVGAAASTEREQTLPLLGVVATATLGAVLWVGVWAGGRPLLVRAGAVGTVCLGVASVGAAVRGALVSVGRRAAVGRLSASSTGADRLRYWGAMLAYLWATGPGERYDTPAERLLVVVTAVAVALAVHLLAAVLSVGTGFGTLFSLALFLAVVLAAELLASPWRLFDDRAQPAPLAALATVAGERARPTSVGRRLRGGVSAVGGGGGGGAAPTESGPSSSPNADGATDVDGGDVDADRADADGGATDDDGDDEEPTESDDRDRECRNCGCDDADRLVERALVPAARDRTPVDLCVACDDAREDRTGDCEAAGLIDRDELLAATGGRCANCGADDDLAAHAVVPLSDRGHRHPWNVLPLCPDCHAEAHANRDAL